MKKLKDPIDSNILVRLLNLHYFVHIIRTFSMENASNSSTNYSRWILQTQILTLRPIKKSIR